MKTVALFCAMVILLMASPVLAGWVVEEVSGDAEDQEVTTLYIQDNKIKAVGSQIMIFDLEKGTFCVVIPQQKVYYIGQVGEMQKQAEAVGKRMEEEYLKQLPPEQREAYEQYRKSMKKEEPPAARKLKVQVKKTSEKPKIVGYSTQKYEVRVDGELVEELWIAPDVNVGAEIDLGKYREFSTSMSSGSAEASYSLAEEYMALMERGYPLKKIEYEEGEQTVTEATKAEKKKIPDSEFRPPKSFRKADMEEMMRAQQGSSE
ncbi:MAG: DUF4412 domain-containing protein [Candidatus Eisenbacteria sp.]|nr:DUF4412 domain-containing protein [Candidatus Eisenbacteria bacterium]